MSTILVLFDRWMKENARDLWNDSFRKAMGDDINSHEIRYVENIKGSYKWSTDISENVKEAYGNPNHIMKHIKDCDAVVSAFAPMTGEIMRASKRLRIIGISRGGPVNVDQNAATKRNIYVLKTVGRNAESVADQTMGFILSESRFIAQHSHAVKTGEYFKNLESLGRAKYLDGFNWMVLNEKTLGLIGFGQVGSRVAKRANSFGMKVIVFDPYLERDSLANGGCEITDLDTVLTQSDFISIHCGLSPETRHLIDKKTINKMKPSAIIINTARGSIINETDLFDALRERRIAGAALDVFEDEPIKHDNPLIQLDNATITPHTAGRSPESDIYGYRQIAYQISNFVKGKAIDPAHVANRQILG